MGVIFLQIGKLFFNLKVQRESLKLVLLVHSTGELMLDKINIKNMNISFENEKHSYNFVRSNGQFT